MQARGALTVLVAISLVSVSALAASSDELVLAKFPDRPGFPTVQRNGARLSIELCYDTCNVYAADRPKSDGEVWDVVFLNEYYFNPDLLAQSFRSSNADHAAAVLSTYASQCPGEAGNEIRARCIAEYLAKRNGVSHSFVRYDEGSRCEVVGKVGDPGRLSVKSKCARVRGAP